jgi:ABC-2 type transport system permease protein
MTTTMVEATPTAVPATALRARFRDLLAAEWIKLWSLRSTPWGLGITALVVIGIGANAASADYANWPDYGKDIRANFDPWWAMNDAFSRNNFLILMLAAGAIGAVAVVSEYSTGLIRTTFAAVPARRSLMAAKVAVIAAVMLVYGALVGLATFGVSQAILSGRHIGLSISYPGVYRALLASALLAPVCALVGMGIGAVIRHTATTIVTTIIALLMLPLLVQSNTKRWVIDLHNAMPLIAWDRLTSPGAPTPQQHQPTIAGSWIVYAAWFLVGAVLAVIVVDRRDV